MAAMLIVLGAWFTYEIVREILRLYDVADSNLKLGVITAGGSALAFVINNAVQSSRERRARLFEAKRDAYGAFIAAFLSFFHRMNRGEEVPQEEMVGAIQNLSTEIMTWGSADTVNAFNRYQVENMTETTEPLILFSRTENILRALRKDLGHSDNSLEKFALTKMLLRGDEHDKLG